VESLPCFHPCVEPWPKGLVSLWNSKDSGLTACSQSLSQLLAASEDLFTDLTPSHHRRLDFAKLIPNADAFDVVQCPLSVVSRTDEDAVGLAEDPFVASKLLVGTVEEIFDGPRHVAEVLGGADDQAVAAQKIFFRGLKGLLEDHVHSFDLRCPSSHGLGHSPSVSALAVVNHQDGDGLLPFFLFHMLQPHAMRPGSSFLTGIGQLQEISGELFQKRTVFQFFQPP